MTRSRPTRAALVPWEGEGVKPIYRHELPAVAWQLLWWLTVHMDEHGMVRGGWRTRAANDIGKNRIWVSRCADRLQEAGLVTTARSERRVQVRTENLVG